MVHPKGIEHILYGLFYIISLVFIFNTGGFEGNAAVYPRTIAAIVIIMTSILLLREFKGKNEPAKKEEFVRKKLYISSIFSVAYIGLVTITGYFIATPLFLIGLTRALGYKNIKAVLATCIVLDLVVYLAFKVALGVPVPGGIIFADF